MSFEMSGYQELLAKLKQMENADEILDEALRESAKILKDEMSQRVVKGNKRPVHIRDDITISEVEGTGTDKFIKVGPGKETGWRAIFLEFGTKFMSAKPFMQPSLESKKSSILEKMAEVIRRKLLK